MFAYESNEIHSYMKNGKGTTRVNSVKIRNNKGTKEMLIKNLKGKTIKKTRKNLKKKEIQNIQQRKFMPNFFSGLKN